MSGAIEAIKANKAITAKTGGRPKMAGTYLLSYLVTLLVLLPVIWIVLLSLRDNAEILSDPFRFPAKLSLDNYARAFQTLNLFRLYTNTFVIAAVTIVIELIITFMSSYALTRLVFRSQRIKKSVFTLFLAGLAIPSFILLFPVYRITISLHLLNSYLSLVLPYIATAISFNTLVLTGFLRGFPGEVEEAAVIDGCGLFTLCKSIVLPIILPVLTTVFVFNILYIWNEFPFAVTLINDDRMLTISLGISQFQGRFSIDYGGILAASTLFIIPQLVFFGFFQRFVIEGMTAGAVKG